jgi:hypothetical protein
VDKSSSSRLEEELLNKSLWGKYEAIEIEFHYSNSLRHDNGRHVWLDVYCPKFNEMRAELGLMSLRPMSLHLTVERLIVSRNNIKHLFAYYYDD